MSDETIKKWASAEPLASSGYDPVADAEANPNGALKPLTYGQSITMGGGPSQLPPGVTIGLPADQQFNANAKPKAPEPPKYEPVYKDGHVVGSREVTPNVVVTGTNLVPGAPGADEAAKQITNPAAPPPDATPAVGYPQAAAPAAPPTKVAATTTPTIHRYAAGGGGPAFDPFAYEKATAEGGKKIGLDEQIGLSVANADRDRALGAAADENTAFGKTVEQQSAANEAQRSQLDAENHKLVTDEAARDYTKEYFSQKNAIGHVADLIGAAAGGFLMGFRGLPSNPYLDQQNKQIDRYIQSAQHNATLKIGESKDLYSHFLDQTKSKEQATALTHAAIMSGLRTQVEKAAADTDDVEKRAHLADVAQSIDMQTAQWNDAAAQARQRAAAGAAAANAAANDPIKLANQQLDLEAKKANVEHVQAETAKLGEGVDGKAPLVNLPDGTQARAVNGEAAGEYTQRMLGAEKFDTAVQKLQEIRTKHGGGTLNPADRKLAEGLAAEAKTAYVQMNGFKRTPNETEFHALDKIVPANAGEFSFSTDEQLAQARTLANEARKQAAGSFLVPQASGNLGRYAKPAPPPLTTFKGIGS